MFTFSSSSSPFGSTLVLCLIVASLITPSRSNHLSDVCIKSKSPRFCLQVFGLNPHRSPYELTQEAINLALTDTYETKNKIHIFLDQTKHHNLKVIYNQCLRYYQSVIDGLEDAAGHFLKDGLYSAVNAIGNRAQVNAFLCENAFQGKIGYAYDSTLTKDNENLEIFGSIIVSAVDLLYNP
ncbi:hypothetical protein R3W88_016147 [Solanum pinnatisectum]|uniref:Pectinesterase inhibitor domain-containing protein n=1 Tax=Solanum pinnatisectum TaxID=50273 RepID=A0AAV9KX17_9SOLN|nr:hypothetical protein R3W88_016147 [Solanum pinnatisectum]